MFKTSLPDEVIVGDKTLKRVGQIGDHKWPLNRLKGVSVRKVKVLSRNLRGRTDLFGRPYQPTVWLYASRPLTSEEIYQVAK
jgi:hypothetical protein